MTQTMLFRTALANLDQQRSRLATTQEQAASGLRINRPSDDPLGAGQSLLMRSTDSAIEQLQRNGSNARSRLAVVEDTLGGASDILLRARELAIQGSNDVQDAESRSLIAREIEGLHDAMLNSANTRFGGGHVFAGFASDTPPFVASGSFSDAPPTAPSVSYVGDSGEVRVAIEEGSTVQVSFDGRRVFQGDADGDGTPDAGREDLFDVLASLRNALINDDGAATSAALERIDRGMSQLSIERTSAGNELSRVNAAAERLDGQHVRVQERLSQVQDADLARVVSDMVRQETALQANLNAMSRLLSPTLMDFLR
ncbi:MAG: flagellar hook-associated protein FlgL [Myxococcales bacterium]|nr:flagellar hook-associated protein FlgL [Myxococcales bacterium]